MPGRAQALLPAHNRRTPGKAAADGFHQDHVAALERQVVRVFAGKAVAEKHAAKARDSATIATASSKTVVELTDEQMEEVEALLEKIEDDDDVQVVFTNIG